MSTVIAKNVQVGTSGTSTDNFTIFQPATPDGTLRIGNGNTGITTSQVALTSAGNVGIGTSSPASQLDVSKTGDAILSVTSAGVQRYQLIARSGGNFEVYDQSNAATRITLTQAGNVGIGTSSPAYKLDVQSASNGFVARFKGGSTGQAGLFYSDATEIDFSDAAGLNNFGLLPGSNVARIVTNGSERARIDSSGNLLVGTTTAGGKIAVYSSTAVDNIKSDSGSAAGTGWTHFNGTSSNNGTQNIKIYGNGNIQNANNSYGSLSDEKLKENIVDATPKLEKLNQVRVVNFNLKGDYEQHKQIGVIAQELEKIFPGMVEETPDRDAEGNDLGTTTKSVKYSVFVPMLVKAIQEQQAIITALTARVEALEGTQP